MPRARAIAEQGFRGLKARALADEAGCAVGAIYNVVADLDELVLLANARTLARSKVADGRRGDRHRPRLGDRPAGHAGAHLSRICRQPSAAMAGAVRSPPGLGQRGAGVVPARSGAAVRTISSGRSPNCSPTTRPERRRLLARSLFSAVHGLVALGLEEKLQFIPLPALARAGHRPSSRRSATASPAARCSRSTPRLLYARRA